MDNEEVTVQEQEEFSLVLRDVLKCMHKHKIYTCLSALTYATAIMLLSIDDGTDLEELLEVADEQLRATTAHLAEEGSESMWSN